MDLLESDTSSSSEDDEPPLISTKKKKRNSDLTQTAQQMQVLGFIAERVTAKSSKQPPPKRRKVEKVAEKSKVGKKEAQKRGALKQKTKVKTNEQKKTTNGLKRAASNESVESQLFAGCVVYMLAEGRSKNIFEQNVTKNGGKVSDKVARDLTHVVIANEIGGSRVDQLSQNLAEQSCKAIVVTSAWVLKSLSRRELEEPTQHLYAKHKLRLQEQEKEIPEECMAQKQPLMYGSESDEEFVEQQNNQEAEDVDFPPKYSCCYPHRYPIWPMQLCFSPILQTSRSLSRSQGRRQQKPRVLCGDGEDAEVLDDRG
jgi:hypothetical protein